MANYSFCEGVHAAPWGLWHIRKLTSVGKKLGGGIDTKSLCDLVENGWDLKLSVSPKLVDQMLRQQQKRKGTLWETRVCEKCSKLYLESLEEK